MFDGIAKWGPWLLAALALIPMAASKLPMKGDLGELSTGAFAARLIVTKMRASPSALC
jgi:hypothetical protein